MSDIKTLLDCLTVKIDNTATKSDLSLMNDKLSAHSIEIDQMKDRMSTIETTVKELQTSLDSAIAREAERKSKTADRGTRIKTTNMADPAGSARRPIDSKRRNLICESLLGANDDKIAAKFIEVADKLGTTVYRSDIEVIDRYQHRDLNDKRPGPVLITLSRIVTRDAILKKKVQLKQHPQMENIFINADEPFETRKAKAILRKIAYSARQQGLEQLDLTRTTGL